MATPEKRAIFSDHERNVLLALVERRKHVIESKKTDFASTKQKQQVWDELTADFNSQSHVMARNAKQLKKCWENVKARAKKEILQERRNRMMTVTGSDPLLLSDGSLQVMAIMQPHINHVDDYFDDDDDEYSSAVLPDKGPPEMITVKAEAMDLADLDDLNETRNSNQEDPRSSSRNTNPDASHEDSSGPTTVGTRQRVTAIQKTVGSLEDQKRKLTVQILREQRSFQIEEHERKTRILQLKEENQLRKRKILKLQESFWQSNLRHRFSVSKDSFE